MILMKWGGFMGKSVKLLFLCLTLAFCAGCSLHSPEELYSLPEPPAEYKNLDQRLQETMTTLGAEYAPPLGGSNTQTVQLHDIDGDGVDEAIAFFRVTTDPKPLKIYIFKQTEEDLYTTYAIIEGEGTAIQSISYQNLGGSPDSEVLVSWRMSERVHSLAAYSVHRSSVAELMRTGYSDFILVDIDMDSLPEVAVLQLDSAEGRNRVELFNYQDQSMVLCATAPLSYEIREIITLRTGYLRDSVRGLFVSSAFGDSNGLITDIFAWREDKLENITLDKTTGQSLDTIRFYNLVSHTDINGDGVLEIPSPEILPAAQKTVAADFWTIHWRQFDINGKSWPIYDTYHNIQDRWYLILPESWAGQVALARRDNTVNGERAVVFSHWLGGETDATPFLTIYKLTGVNREMRSRMGNRFVLLDQPDAIYAAEFHENAWDCGLDQESLAEHFSLIHTEWSTDY